MSITTTAPVLDLLIILDQLQPGQGGGGAFYYSFFFLVLSFKGREGERG